MINNMNNQDQEQRLTALDVTQSFIVQAPAGSGKTELIIQRLLSLLSKVNSPDEILAITFTKKATNEMRSRVLATLKQAEENIVPDSLHAKLTFNLAKKVLEQDKKHDWNLLQNPNQLRIQTIDSFCSYLAKQLPLLSRFGASPAITLKANELYQEAVNQILNHLETDLAWSASLQKLLLHLDNDLNKLSELLISLLAKRDQWLPYIQFAHGENNIKQQLEHQFTLTLQDKLMNLKEIFSTLAVPELLALLRFASEHADALKVCQTLTALPPATLEHRETWFAIAKFLLTKSNSWRKRVDKEIGFPALASLKNPQEKLIHHEFRERYQFLIEDLSQHEELREALVEIFNLPEIFYQTDQWDILQALLYVLKMTVAQLQLVFKSRGQIDFIENAQAGLMALGDSENPTDLTLALDYQIKHILIDEFQDTSLTQYHLLEKLTMGWEPDDGRTLFVVGDPMQSIYRFREAEVGLFLRLWQNGLGQIPLHPLRLTVNFRSLVDIVEWNNATFSNIFPKKNNIAMGAVTYHPSSIFHHTCGEKPHIKGFVTTDKKVEAHYIAKLIGEIKTKDATTEIAILVRSRSDLVSLLPILKQNNISYEAIDIEPLASRQIIQDLLSLTCALLHPYDRIAWFSLLRAPWCGLTLSDLLLLAGEHPYATIIELLDKNAIISQLSDDGQKRLARILPILKQKLNDRERYPLRYWIENAWLLLGGPACLRDHGEMDDVITYFKLLESFEQLNTLDINYLKTQVEKLYASGTKASESAVQIMTIHSAKGLEFDVVIMPYLQSTTPADDKSLLLYMEYPLQYEKMALLLAPIHATGEAADSMYEFIYRQKKIKSDFEADRLFYVGTTRAKKQLHLTFSINKCSIDEYKPIRGSFLAKLWPQILPRIETILEYSSDQHSEEKNESNLTRLIARLPVNWQNPVLPPVPSPIAYHQQQTGFAIRETTSAIIGTIIHKILQMIAMQGKAWWDSITDSYIHQQLMQSGLTSSDLTFASSRIKQAVNNTLQDKRGLWILQPHLNARAEFAITAEINGEVQRLVIDRTFIDENGVRWVIDYKSGTYQDNDLEGFLLLQRKRYVDKMIIYKDAVQVLGDNPVRLGLYFPALPLWLEL